MKNSKRIGWLPVLVLTAAVVVGAGACYLIFGLGDEESRPGEPIRLRTVHTNELAKASRQKAGKGRKKSTVIDPAMAKRIRPNLSLESEDEAKLSEKMLAIYRELQEALDKDDRKQVFALVHKLQAMDEWPDGIPLAVKKRALDALAWYGAPGIAEAIGFLADSSQEIRDTAIDTFEKQLSDSWDLGDKKLGETLVSMAKVVTDADALDTFYDQLDNMRPSVRAQTVADIYKSGTESAKAAMDQKLEDVFMNDDVQVKERADVEKALKTALEQEADATVTKDYDEQYGPAKWDW